MFRFKEKSSESMNCVVEEEINLLKRASKLVESNREGRNDSLDYTEYGYSPVDGSIDIFMLDISKRDEIFSWLCGNDYLEYNNRVSKCAFYEAIDLTRVASINKASFAFIRAPFWYKKDDDFVIVEDEIINCGNVEVEPIIRLEKNTSEKIDLSINDIRFTYIFPEDENYVEIDCQDGNARYEGLYRNENLFITFEFPLLTPGSNTIVKNLGDSTIKVKRKDCWL